jgi:N-methylhydantoinase A
MHAASVGRAVDVGAVLIPRHPGAFSALGLVSADVRYDLVQTAQRPVASLSAEDVEGLYAPLLERASARLAALGQSAGQLVRVGRFRYAWQDNDVDVIVGDEPVTAGALNAAVSRFHELHEFEFGYSNPEDPVELSAVALEAYGPLPRLRVQDAAGVSSGDASPAGARQVCFRETGWVDTAVYERADLRPGSRLHGPAIVEEREATTVVGPGVELEVDGLANLLLRRKDA